jgi:tetratricopeptide (TPR) repeat protein
LAYAQLALCYQLKGEDERASKYLLKAYELNPDFKRMHEQQMHDQEEIRRQNVSKVGKDFGVQRGKYEEDVDSILKD